MLPFPEICSPVGNMLPFAIASLLVSVNSYYISSSVYLPCKHQKGAKPMEATRNLCAQIPISLHEKVMEEKTELGQSLAEYVTQILKEHFEGGNNTMAASTKTLAFQIPEELDRRLKDYLNDLKNRTGKKVSQKEFVIGLIEQALAEHEALHGSDEESEN